MNTEMYFGGLPTEPDVRKLQKAYPSIAEMRGSIITHDEIEPVIGYKREETRYRTVVNAWRRKVEAETGVVLSARGDARGIGYMVLIDSDQLAFGVKEKKSAGRKMLRAWSVISATNDERLTPQELKVKEHELVAAGKIYMAITESKKPKFLPKPKSETTLVGIPA